MENKCAKCTISGDPPPCCLILEQEKELKRAIHNERVYPYVVRAKKLKPYGEWDITKRAAFILSQAKIPQNEIAKLLSISQSMVSLYVANNR